MSENSKLMINREILDLRRVVKGSKLGRHITENILIPILKKIDPFVDEMLDWIGWYISEEIKHVLATSRSSSDWTYEVYFVDTTAPKGQKYTKIGEYTPSAKGSPPYSPDVGGDPDIPPSGTLLRSIDYMITNRGVVLGIRDNVTPYHLWYKWGKLFVGDEIKPRSAATYGMILDSPDYSGTGGSNYRPYFRETVRQMKPKMKKRFREQFKQQVIRATKRPTVRRAIEIHFRWSSVQ